MKKTAQGKEEIHMTELLKLPVGIENFEEIRRDNFYYVDKTKLIEQLLSQCGKSAYSLFIRIPHEQRDWRGKLLHTEVATSEEDKIKSLQSRFG